MAVANGQSPLREVTNALSVREEVRHDKSRVGETPEMSDAVLEEALTFLKKGTLRFMLKLYSHKYVTIL